jgi:hypothetical protein
VSEQAGRYQRSFSGMIGALVVLLGVIGAFVVLREANRTDPANPVKAIEYAEDVAYYRTEATFPMLAPPTLPAGWYATSQEFIDTKPQSWHLGVLTDKGRYVGLEQGRDSVPTMVSKFVDENASQGDPVQVAGVAWESFSDSGGDHALVRRQDGVTTLVVGTVPVSTLQAYVESLR